MNHLLRPARRFVARSWIVFTAIMACTVPLKPADAQVTQAPPATRLAVLLNYASLSTTAETLVDAISGKTSPADRAQWQQRFQNPTSARLLIQGQRLSPAVRQTLTAANPDEILHRYIVLDFKDAQAATAAKAALEKDAGVSLVQESTYGTFLAVPSDPYYAYSATSNRDYQWSINDTMGMQQAWNSVRGTAYLAHLDNGIQLLPTIHEDLVQPLRRFRFNVAGGTDVDEHPELTSQYGGHGTHTAGIMAGATSQNSVAPGYPNPSPVGIAGTCWYCSLLVAKISRPIGGYPTIDFTTDVPAALYWAVNSGAQVVNVSFGGQDPLVGQTPDPNCTLNPSAAFCAALASAAAKQVVVVAAAGNSDLYNLPTPPNPGYGIGTKLDFPASNPNTVAVAAAQWYTTAGTTNRINLWTEESVVLQGFVGTSGGPGMETRGILAPGRDILSTFYNGKDWNPYIRCGTSASFPYAPGSNRGPKYGICTGTSMAAPHITGIVGLMRTVNPLLDAVDIRTKLLASGGNAATPNTLRGYGLVNANTAVNSVLGTTNRLTPLFSLYSSTAANHFYSVVPQMARAAIAGGLIPYANAPTQYLPYGTQVNGYTFPDPATIGYVAPRAQVWVFTTHTNPASGTAELMPLYRLSWSCGDGGTSTCSTNPYHVSHVYTTSIAEATAFGGLNYQFDGIEGYVYPLSLAQPAGTSLLMRAYNSSRDDYAVFPQSEQANMAADGYTANLTNLGYVYLNSGNRPTY